MLGTTKKHKTQHMWFTHFLKPKVFSSPSPCFAVFRLSLILVDTLDSNDAPSSGEYDPVSRLRVARTFQACRYKHTHTHTGRERVCVCVWGRVRRREMRTHVRIHSCAHTCAHSCAPTHLSPIHFLFCLPCRAGRLQLPMASRT